MRDTTRPHQRPVPSKPIAPSAPQSHTPGQTELLPTYRIIGHVSTRDKRPASGIVVLYAQKVGSETEVTRIATGADGSYAVAYDPTNGSAARPVFVVAFLNPEGEEVARIGPIEPTGTDAAIDLTVSDTGRSLSEFESLQWEVEQAATAEHTTIDQLQDTAQRPDVAVLAHSLNVPTVRVRAFLAARAAARMFFEDGAPAAARPLAGRGAAAQSRRARQMSKSTLTAVFYALWRDSSDFRIGSLLSQRNVDLGLVLRRAVDARRVPRQTRPAVQPFLQRLDRLRARQIVESGSSERAGTFADAIRVAVHEQPLRQKIADLAVAHGSDRASSLNALSGERRISGEATQQVLSAVDMLDISSGHVRLVETLAAKRLLDPRKLAKLTLSDWKQLLQSKSPSGAWVGTPGLAPARVPKTAAVTSAASLLETAVDRRYPTERFLERLLGDSKKNHPLVKARRDLQRFFEANPDFHIRDTPIDALLAQKTRSRASRFAGVKDPDRTLLLLKGLQRLYRLFPDPAPSGAVTPEGQSAVSATFDRYDAASALIAADLDSAPKIVSSPRAPFVEKYSGLFGGSAGADLIYRRAVQVSDLSIMKALEARELAFPTVPTAQPTVDTWQNQFGSLELCACEQCSSMNSPAAYLFDCLKLLQDGPLVAGKTPLDILKARRADLVRLALTCDNTNVKLPYIDLVNELLEREVVPSYFKPFNLTGIPAADLAPGVVSTSVRAAFLTATFELSLNAYVTVVGRAADGTPKAWHLVDGSRLFEIHRPANVCVVDSLTFQTHGTEDELRAAPTNLVSQAYTTLLTQVFPWHLPFSLFHAEIETYLERVLLSLEAILEAFDNGGATAAARRDDVAASYLGLSPEAFAIVVGQTLAGPGLLGGTNDRPADFWGGKAGIFENVPTLPGLPPILGTWDVVLSYVPLFLKRSELTYVELLQLLDCYFINPFVLPTPRRKISIVSLVSEDPATCELDKLQLMGLDIDGLKKIHRFVRLKRALEWDYIDIDRALTALDATDLDGDTVVALTIIARLSEKTGLSVRELLTLWGDIDHAVYLDRTDIRQESLLSLYDELFRKNPYVSTPDASFVADPSLLTGKIADHLPALIAALTVSETDINALRNDPRVLPADADLTLQNLSSLYRYAALAGFLDISPTALLSLLDVAQDDPLDLPAGATRLDRVHAVWSFVITTSDLLVAGTDVATLVYLLTADDRSDTSGLAIPVDEIALLLDGLRSTLAKLYADSTYPPDSSGRTIVQELVKMGWDQNRAATVQRFFANSEVYTEHLDPQFVPAALPPDLRVRYNATLNQLQSVGTLSSHDLEVLYALPNLNQTFTTAVANLAAAPRQFAATALGRIAPPIYSIALSELPSGLSVPVECQRALTFDPIGRRLRFRGDRALLDTIVIPANATGSAWTAFAAALNALKADPTPANIDEEPPAIMNAFFASNQDRDDFSNQVSDPSQRCALAMAAIRRASWNTSAPRIVSQTLGTRFSLDGPAMEAARPLWDPLAFESANGSPSRLATTGTAITIGAFPQEFAIVRRLHKLGLLLSGLSAPVEATPWLLAHASALFGFDLLALPASPGDAPATLAAYRAVQAFVRVLKQKTTAGPRPWQDLLDLVNQPTFTRTQWLAAVADLYQENVVVIDALTSPVNIPINVARSPQFYLEFVTRLQLVKRTGIAAGTLGTLYRSLSAHDDVRWAGDFSKSTAEDVKLAIQGLVTRDRWLKMSGEIQDGLRERRRDALVSYLLARGTSADGMPFKDDADLFGYLLIDVEMESCMTTSRLKQAISSVQTFIQRTILNLEPGAVLSADDAETWQAWRKRYRLWEANRRILVYPENWIEPSLRDDKSGEYRVFESSLLQVDLTNQTAWEALEGFAAARADIANLEVCAVHEQVIGFPGTPAGSTALHVFGRTRSTPQKYYYRRRDRSDSDAVGIWTAWQKLDLEIEGDYLLPISVGGRLYLLWPLIKELTLDTATGDAPNRYFSIDLAWSIFDGTSWSSKYTFIPPDRDKVTSWKIGDRTASETLSFQVSTDGSAIDVWCYGAHPALVPVTTTTTPPPPPPTGNVTDASPSLNPVPSLTVTVISGSMPVPGAIVALGSRGPVGFLLAPPMPWVTDTSAVRITDTQGMAVINLPTDIILGRSASLSVLAISPALGPPQMFVMDLEDWLVLPLQVSVTVAFEAPTVVTNVQMEWPPDHPTTINGVGAYRLHLTNKAESFGNFNFGQLTPPVWTQPDGGWWEEQANQGDAFYLPGRIDPVFQLTIGTYRLLPEPLFGPIASRSQFAFECNRKTYLLERSNADRMLPPRFTTFFDAEAEWLRLKVQSMSSNNLSRSTQMATDSGHGFTSVFGDTGTGNAITPADYPQEKIEFERHDVFAIENWELFFHAPFQIACLLLRHNRFADAQRWFHHIYNPLSSSAASSQPASMWQFLPFYQTALNPPTSIADLLLPISSERDTLLAWQKNPFNPYAVARTRYQSFMKAVVIRYLDNLLAWGDQLFRQETIESTNEASQIYLLASQILGDRPQLVPARATPVLQTFQSLSDNGLTATLGSAIGLLAVDISAFIDPSASPTPGNASLGQMLYFCVPANDTLGGYWDVVQSRLRNIRECRNIEGRHIDYALFEPRIDPGLLVRAQAAGLDLGDILNDLYAPPPHYRFSALAQKATEIVNDLRALGAALLAAIEKRDAESLALLRQTHELTNFNNMRDVRLKQVDDAAAQLRALTKSRGLAALRLSYYQRLLGDPHPATPKQGDPVVLAEYLPASLPAGAGLTEIQGLTLASHETQQINWLDSANDLMLASNAVRVISSVLHAIPNTTLPLSFGGIHVGPAADAIAGLLQMLATNATHQANRLSLLGGFVRRQDEWTLQRNVAAQELTQIDSQLEGADIRQEIAKTEVKNQDAQIEQNKTITEYFRSKFSNEELYDWMAGQLTTLYFQSYQLSYRVARQAEVAFRRELGLQSSNWIQFGYWDGLKKGLLAGEALALDLKRMEVGYLEQNSREFEITKHISLVSLDPTAFIDLKTSGACEFALPEWLFDLDYPGQYVRRIRAISITIPCVVGPYASVNCSIALESSSVRIDSDATNKYERRSKKGVPTDDSRFVDNRGLSETIVTSSGQSDSGLFEVNLRDDRYLPFEGHGAISRWRVDLPRYSNGFSPDSMADVILHVRYTARDGGDDLRQAALDSVNAMISKTATSPLYRMLSLRHDYPSEWNRYRAAGGKIGPLDLSNRMPALFARRSITIGSARSYLAVNGDAITPVAVQVGAQEIELAATQGTISIGSSTQSINLTGTTPDDLLIVCPYIVGPGA